jgi:pimeloyl-ACP methyl ester carboxylesterase
MCIARPFTLPGSNQSEEVAMRDEFVEVDRCRVRLQRHGKGPTLLFLHGANGPALWTPFFDELAKRYHVIAPDHPTFGASGDAEWLEDIGDLAYFYLDFLKELQLQRVHLVGHSMGGWLAAEIAVRSTQRLATVTLMSAAGLRVPGESGVDIFMTPPLELVGQHIYADPKLGEAARTQAETAAPELIDAFIRNRTAAARICWHPRLNNPKLARWLHRIDVPAHLVWGDADRIIPPAHAKAYRGYIPGAKLTMIRNAGHVPQVERPKETLEAVAGFFQEHAL